MKKYLFIVTVFFLTTAAFAQKKKPVKASNSAALVKLNNLSIELIKNKLYLFIDNKGAKRDTIILKSYEGSAAPIDCKISPFTTKGTALHLISWTETAVIESKDKTENKSMQYSEIWNLKTKSKAFSNLQTTTKIKEIQYLDKLKNASQTVEKIRNEGLSYSLTKDGDVFLKNKTQENTLSYNVSSNVYQNVKDITPKKK